MIELLRGILYWFLLIGLAADVLAAGYYFGKFAAGEETFQRSTIGQAMSYLFSALVDLWVLWACFWA